MCIAFWSTLWFNYHALHDLEWSTVTACFKTNLHSRTHDKITVLDTNNSVVTPKTLCFELECSSLTHSLFQGLESISALNSIQYCFVPLFFNTNYFNHKFNLCFFFIFNETIFVNLSHFLLGDSFDTIVLVLNIKGVTLFRCNIYR